MSLWIPLAFAVIALCCSLGAVAVTVLSAPNVQRNEVQSLHDRVRSAETTVEGVQARMTTWASEVSGLLEEVENQLELARKARAKARSHLQSAEKKEAQNEGEGGNGFDPFDRMALVSRARQMGHDV